MATNLYKKALLLPNGLTGNYHRIVEYALNPIENLITVTIASWVEIPDISDITGNIKQKFPTIYNQQRAENIDELEQYFFSLPEFQGAVKVDYSGNPI